MRLRPGLLSVAAALCGIAIALPVTAQESTTRGFTLGVHASGASLSVENQDRNNAGGGGLRVGWGFNRRFTLMAQLDGAKFDDQSGGDVDGEWTMGHFDLGARFHFANSLSKWIPFLEGAVGYRAVSVSDAEVDDDPVDEVSLSGAGITLGGGVDYYFNESLALDLTLLWTGGQFSTLRVDNVTVGGFAIDANSTRFNVGISWWP